MRYLIVLALLLMPLTAIAQVDTSYYVVIDIGAAEFTGTSDVVGEWNGTQTEGPWASNDDGTAKIFEGATLWTAPSTFPELVDGFANSGSSWTAGSYISWTGLTNNDYSDGSVIDGGSARAYCINIPATRDYLKISNFVCQDSTDRGVYVNASSDYLTFDNLIISSCDDYGMVISGTNPDPTNISVLNSTIYDHLTAGILIGDGPTNVTVDGCTIHSNIKGLSFQGTSTDFTLSNSTLYCQTSGIYWANAEQANPVIFNNTFYDNLRAMDGNTSVTTMSGSSQVIRNLFYNNQGLSILVFGATGGGSDAVAVQSNIIYDSSIGIATTSFYRSVAEIYNNTIAYCPTGISIGKIDDEVQAYNNIIFEAGYGFSSATEAADINNNCFWSIATDIAFGCSTGASDIYSNPNFTTSTTNPDEADFRGSVSVPLYGAGTWTVGTYPDYTDADNLPFWENYMTIGAYRGPLPTPSPFPAESPPATPYFPTPSRTPTTPTPIPTPTSALTPTPQPTPTPTPKVITPTPTIKVITPTPSLTPSPTPKVITPTPTVTPSPSPSPADMRYRDLTATRTLWVHWSGGTGPWGPYAGTSSWQYDNNIPNTGGYWLDQWDTYYGPWETRPTRSMMTFEYPPTATPTPAEDRFRRTGLLLKYW